MPGRLVGRRIVSEPVSKQQECVVLPGQGRSQLSPECGTVTTGILLDPLLQTRETLGPETLTKPLMTLAASRAGSWAPR